jgi:hypothetical protein
MTVLPGMVPRRAKRIATPGLKGLAYPEQKGLRDALAAQDPRFVEYVLKPATDEMWNRIDAVRSVATIIDETLLEFDLRTEQGPWLAVFEGWCKAGLIRLDPAGAR